MMTVAALFATFRVLHSAELSRSQWGTRVPVLMIVKPVARGEQVTAAHLRVSEQPQALWRAGMSSKVGDVVGRRASEQLRVGDTIIRERTRTDQSGIAARLDPDERGVAVPRTDALPTLRVGDRVSLVDSAGGVEILGRIIDQSERVVTVSVKNTAIAGVTAAVQRSSLAIVLRP